MTDKYSCDISKGFPGGTSGRESAPQCRKCKRGESDPWDGRASGGGGNGNCSSVLAWRIPWIKELGGLQSMNSQGIRHD